MSAAQRLLQGGPDLPLPPPRGRHRHRLTLRKPTQGPAGLSLRVLVEDGTPVGDVVVGTELDPYADAVLTAAQSAGVRLVLTHDPGAPELAGRADEVLTGPSSMAGQIHRLQTDGQVVAVLAADEAALAVADVGIGVIPPAGRVPWAADILCGPGLLEVPRLLTAVPAARTVSARGVTSAMAATFLGGLLTAVGGCSRQPSRRPRRARQRACTEFATCIDIRRYIGQSRCIECRRSEDGLSSQTQRCRSRYGCATPRQRPR